MSLDKGIKHGKEKRKQYYGSKAIDKSCRNHGSDDWALANRKYQANREEERTAIELNEYKKGVNNMGLVLAELKEKLKKLEAQQFYHEMKDHWDAADFDHADSLSNQIRDLEEKIKEMENLDNGND